MKIGILETGGPPLRLTERFGGYPGMIRAMLPGYDFAVFDVTAGEWPSAPEEREAYLITGSPAGVYDDLPWIADLIAWLRRAKGSVKLVGICFGHQIMAEAFGGRVAKSNKGWGIGLHRYEVCERAPWMDAAPSFAIPVSHQDQVIEMPPHACVLAGSAFTPFGLIAYRDQPAISFQCHPEFTPDFAKALIEARQDRLPDPDGAIASLDEPDDRAQVAGWIRRFLERPVPEQM